MNKISGGLWGLFTMIVVAVVLSMLSAYDNQDAANQALQTISRNVVMPQQQGTTGMPAINMTTNAKAMHYTTRTVYRRSNSSHREFAVAPVSVSSPLAMHSTAAAKTDKQASTQAASGPLRSTAAATVHNYGGGGTYRVDGSYAAGGRTAAVAPAAGGAVSLPMAINTNRKQTRQSGYVSSEDTYRQSTAQLYAVRRYVPVIGGDDDDDDSSVWATWLKQYYENGTYNGKGDGTAYASLEEFLEAGRESGMQGLDDWWNETFSSGYTPDIYSGFNKYVYDLFPIGDGLIPLLLMIAVTTLLRVINTKRKLKKMSC